MLEIDDLTYRIGARSLFEGASASISAGWKVGLVGRNGTGKSTLLRLIREEAGRGAGSIRLKSGARLGHVAQEAPPTDQPLIEFVLSMNEERAALFAEAEHATDPDRIGEIHARLEEIDAYSAEARASAILVGLGFQQHELSRPCREFSGGWRMRAALAGVLFAEPDLLMLDEPTNYLDLEGASWLEAYLKRYPNTVILVSHDREMLNRCVTHTLALADLKLEVHPGGYDTYLKKRAERAANLASQKAKQDAQRAHLQSFIDRFRAKASKATQAQSRIKMLERMQDIAVPLEERTTPFKFIPAEELSSPLIVLEDADLGYVADKTVLGRVNFRLDHDDRIVILGPNGQGKSTLVKSIGGRLDLLKGRRTASRACRVGYFSQDQLDELRAGETVLEHVRGLNPNLSNAAHRAIAAQMGFPAEKIETKVEKLSGGEKVRLLLGMIAHTKPHVLILDEPTSHLDIDSREALIHAINEFEGAVLLITHDVYLAEAAADRLWLVHDGRADPYDGDLSAYRKLVLAADRRERKPTAPAPTPQKHRSVSPSDLKRKLAAAEATLEAAQKTLAELDHGLADPAIYTKDPAKAAKLSAARDAAQAEVDAAELAWLEAGEAYDAVSKIET